MSKDEHIPADDEFEDAFLARLASLNSFRQLYRRGVLSEEARRQVDDCVSMLASLATGLSRPEHLGLLRRMHATLEQEQVRRAKAVAFVERALRQADHREAAGNLRAELTWWVDPAFKALDPEFVFELIANPGRRRARRIAAILSVAVNAFGDRDEQQAVDAFKGAVRELAK